MGCFYGWYKRPKEITPVARSARKTISNAKATSDDEDQFFSSVAKELALGQPDEALWTKAFALEEGDENKTKARYIRLRVAQLAQESRSLPAEAPQVLAAVPGKTRSPFLLLGVALIGVVAFITVQGFSKPAPAVAQTPNLAAASNNTSNIDFSYNPSKATTSDAPPVDLLADKQKLREDITSMPGISATPGGLRSDGTYVLTVSNTSNKWHVSRVSIILTDAYQQTEVLNGRKPSPPYSEKYSVEVDIPPNAARSVEVPTQWNELTGFLMVSQISGFASHN